MINLHNNIYVPDDFSNRYRTLGEHICVLNDNRVIFAVSKCLPVSVAGNSFQKFIDGTRECGKLLGHVTTGAILVDEKNNAIMVKRVAGREMKEAKGPVLSTQYPVVNIRQKHKTMNSEIYFCGNFIGAVVKDVVSVTYPLDIPETCDRDAYLDKAESVLKHVGKVVTGTIWEKGGAVYFNVVPDESSQGTLIYPVYRKLDRLPRPRFVGNKK